MSGTEFAIKSALSKVSGRMSYLCISVFLCTMILDPLSVSVLSQSGAESGEESVTSGEDPVGIRGYEESNMPYWNMWSSDFYGWMEELRAQGAYEALMDLTRTYWLHFPVGSYLGYDSTVDQEQYEDQYN